MILVRKIIAKLKHVRRFGSLLNQFTLIGCLLLLVCFVCSCFIRSHPVPQHLRKYLRFEDGYLIPDREISKGAVKQLMVKIQKQNADVEMLNWKDFDEDTTNTTIIVIQVHKDVERLQNLIVSLAQADAIQQALLIFSHSHYDKQINELIETIDFCKVMQIFYPYSLQLHPKEFPGFDRADGYQRDARRSQDKHHWWWKAHFIFDVLNITRIVLFLTEDDYVLPDFLYMLRQAELSIPNFPFMDAIALGKPFSINVLYDTLMLDSWRVVYNIGLAFNISTWRKIREKASSFCKYDDYRWSQSLQHVFDGFPKKKAYVMTCVAARVFTTERFLRGSEVLAWASALAQAAPLFPAKVRSAVRMSAIRRSFPKPKGGWADFRDQDLCLNMLNTEPATYHQPRSPLRPFLNYSLNRMQIVGT